ncbi:MAG: hypothetical protein PHZ04_04085 [Patescibacteria group bacterium]|nr:hypothetical protein [Patescibacteria group bacterium]MDD5294358.1 hypothetical protein [Patescibacteria group bacterium]MDD5554025.1 hypothetical protein [Patescibacteria group bacterium]
MKKLTVILALSVALLYLAGCSAYFGNTSGFRKGDWYGLASSEEAARITQQVMAINKMEATTDSPKSKSRAEKINSSSATINLAELSRFAHLDSSGRKIIINLAKLSQLAPLDSSIKTVTINLKELNRLAHLNSSGKTAAINLEELSQLAYLDPPGEKITINLEELSQLAPPDTSIKTVTINLKELGRLAHLDSPAEMIVIDSERAGQSSTLIDPIMGYKGIVANTDEYATVNTIIRGPETKSYLLPPGFWVEDYLIPGDYVAESFYHGQKIGSWKFTVGLQTQSYMGKSVHWYTYCDL